MDVYALFFGLHLVSQRGGDALRELTEVGLTARFIGDQDAKEDRGISRPIFAKLRADADDVRLKELGRTLHRSDDVEIPSVLRYPIRSAAPAA